MPSGPRKRKAARRRQQEPHSDDRDTEKDSVSESYDEHDEEQQVSPKTPGKGECGGAALDKDALSGGAAPLDKDALTQQTEEWLRVSSFDVGTPSPQTPSKLREGGFDDEEVGKTSSNGGSRQGEETSNHAQPHGDEHGSTPAAAQPHGDEHATDIPESRGAEDGDDQIQVNASSEEKEESIAAPQEFHCINTYQLSTSAPDEEGKVLQSEKHAAVIASQPGDKVVTLSCKVHEQQRVVVPSAGCCGVLDWLMGRSD